MAKYIKGEQRGQLVLFNECIEDRIEAESSVRVIDYFVENIDLQELGFKRNQPNEKGTNHYDDKDLLKLYLYGYRNKVRSSRKLAELCKVNIEVMWLIRGIEPDFRIISDFRKENIKSLKEVFKKLVMMCNDIGIIGREFSQDGVKIEAVNSKERNYTLNKLDDRIKRIEEKIDKYMKEIEEIDNLESEIKEKSITLEEMEKKLEEEKRKKEEYNKIIEEIEEAGENQKSLTDEESRLMKNNGKFSVCYNDQVLVDEKSHLIVNFEVDNNPADVGRMKNITADTKEYLGIEEEIVKNITDKGYNDRKDMKECLENGIIPEVTLARGEENYEIETEYEEREISEEVRKSRKKEDIKASLRAGIIPEIYEEFIEDIEVVEKTEYQTLEEVEKESINMREAEIREFAMENECFMKDKEKDRVYCPQGEILRPKSKHGKGKKYCNKLACKNCKKPCTMAKYKEAVMNPEQILLTSNQNLKKSFPQKKKRRKKVIKKVVRFKLKPKVEDTKRRMGISEHSHGTMKRSDDASYFLLKGKEKVNGELALYYCASNLRRLENIMGVSKILEYFGKKIEEKMA